MYDPVQLDQYLTRKMGGSRLKGHSHYIYVINDFYRGSSSSLFMQAIKRNNNYSNFKLPGKFSMNHFSKTISLWIHLWIYWFNCLDLVYSTNFWNLTSKIRWKFGSVQKNWCIMYPCNLLIAIWRIWARKNLTSQPAARTKRRPCWPPPCRAKVTAKPNWPTAWKKRCWPHPQDIWWSL